MIIHDYLTLMALAATNPFAAVCTTSNISNITNEPVHRWVDHASCLLSVPSHVEIVMGTEGYVVRTVQPHGPWPSANKMTNTCEYCRRATFERWRGIDS